MLKPFLIVGLGGFIGSVARYSIAKYFQENMNSVFPWSTFIINILGSLLIGIIYGISEKNDLINDEMRLFIAVGICGGFTTFSTFSNDNFMLLRSEEWIRFTLFTTLSVFLGLIAVYVGRLLTKII